MKKQTKVVEMMKEKLAKTVLSGSGRQSGEAAGIWCPTMIFHQPKRPKLPVDIEVKNNNDKQ